MAPLFVRETTSPADLDAHFRAQESFATPTDPEVCHRIDSRVRNLIRRSRDRLRRSCHAACPVADLSTKRLRSRPTWRTDFDLKTPLEKAIGLPVEWKMRQIPAWRDLVWSPC